jgi:hypothetical protein
MTRKGSKCVPKFPGVGRKIRVYQWRSKFSGKGRETTFVVVSTSKPYDEGDGILRFNYKAPADSGWKEIEEPGYATWDSKKNRWEDGEY